MLTLSRRQDPVVSAAPPKYALVMLDEDQVSTLLGTPQMRRLNAPPHAYDPHVRYVRLKRVMAALMLAAALGAGAAAWWWVPRPALAAVFPWAATPVPTVATAASFSVAVAAPPGADAAARVARRLRGLALPVFTRRHPATGAPQVMVGPYVSLDEAEGAQRLLRTLGHGGRLFVDESVRNATRNEVRTSAAASDPEVLLVGAPDRLALVIQLDAQPRRVSSNRVTGTTFEIEIGPVSSPVRARQWSAPAGVHLVRHIGIEESGDSPGGGRFLRAIVSLPEFSQASARVDGPRVYVDLTWPPSGEGAIVPVPPRVHSAQMSAESQPAPAPAADYLAQIAPSIARFEQMTPFLLSAAKSPSPPVLEALSGTLKSLEATLAGVSVPPDAFDGHTLMTKAAVTARLALDPAFTGDRVVQTQQAVAMFRGAKGG